MVKETAMIIEEEGLTLKLERMSKNFVRYKVYDCTDKDVYHLNIWREDDNPGCMWCLDGKHMGVYWETDDYPADDPEEAITDATAYILALRVL